MKLPSDLTEAFEDNSLIVVVGSRVSMSAGLPSLPDFARGLIESADWDSEDEAEQMRNWIDKRRTNEVLDQLRSRMGAEFDREVERRLTDNGREVPNVARSLSSLRKKLRAIYTTRLDRLIERAFAGRWPSFATPRADFAQRRRMIFKLRGTLEFVQSWVLTAEQEERELLGRSPRRAVLESAYEAHRLLFIGFDADDEELDLVLKAARAGQAENAPEHFIALASCTREERSALQRRGLTVIRADGEEVLEALGAEEEGEDSLLSGGCPYPGLDVFTEDMASVFFGRHAEISQAASRLGGDSEDHNRWLSVEGQAGVGKSSFVLAGVLPALRNGFAAGLPERWMVATMRPGSNPIDTLAQNVCAALGPHDPEKFATALHESPKALADMITKKAPKDYGFLLVIDQLEEVVAFASQRERALFQDAISRALEAKALYLITSMRSDFVPTLQEKLPALAALLNEHAERYVLPPISRVGLREAITEPAALRGVLLEPALLEQIMRDAETGTDSEGVGASALPLVAHALRGLWHASTSRGSMLGIAEYEALGGVIGALGRSADRILTNLNDDDRHAAQALLLQLVRVERDGNASRRRISRDQAVSIAGGTFGGRRGMFNFRPPKAKKSKDDTPADEQARRNHERGVRVLLALSGGAAERAAGVPSARLLTIISSDGQTLVELVHEALVRDWETLRVWIDENRRQLLLNDELGRRADKWAEVGKPTRGLPRGHELRELLEGLPLGDKADLQEEYQAALRKALLVRSATWIGLGAVTTAASVAAAVFFMQLASDLEKSKAELDANNAALTEANTQLERSSEEITKNRDELAANAVLLRAQSSSNAALAATMLAREPGRHTEALVKALEAYAGYEDRSQVPPLVEEAVFATTSGIHHMRELDGHLAPLGDLAYAPDGSSFASASNDKTARVWDAETFEASVHEGHADAVTRVVYSDDSKFVLTRSNDTSAKLWRSTGDLKRHIQPGYDVTAIGYSQDGMLATGGADGELDIWTVPLAADEKLANQQSIVTGDREVTDIAFTPDGSRIVATMAGGKAGSWNVASGGSLASVSHSQGINCLALSVDGSRAATGADVVKLWDTQTGAVLATLDTQDKRGKVKSVAFAPKRARVVSTYMLGLPVLWDSSTGKPVTDLDGHVGGVWSASFSPTGSLLATAGADDGLLNLWDPDRGSLRTVLESQAQLQHLVWSPSGEQFVTGDISTTAPRVRVWQAAAATETLLAQVSGATTSQVALTPDGTRVAFNAGSDAGVSVWDGQTGTRLHDKLATNALGLAFSPDGTRLAIGDSLGEVSLFDVGKGASIDVLDDQESDVTRVAFAGDGQTLATGGHGGQVWLYANGKATELPGLEGAPVIALMFADDGKLVGATPSAMKLWDATGTEIAIEIDGPPLTGLRAAAISPKGDRIAVATDSKTIALIDGSAKLPGSFDLDHAMDVIAFSHDGQSLALGGGRSVIMYGLDSGRRVEIARHDADVVAVAFSPDDSAIVSASRDGVAMRWLATPHARALLACEALALTSQFAGIQASCSALGFAP